VSRILQKCKKGRTPVFPHRLGQELIIDQQRPQLVRHAKCSRGSCSPACAFDRRKGKPRKPTYGGIVVTATLEFQTRQTPQKFFPRI
jgi:hypothetical protein